MNESGITSQYGFLFQRKVFVLYVLENMNVKQRFCFEGKDDVEIAADEKIYELDSSESNCVQVKSGQVDQSCFSKVVGNWLLLDSVKPERYTLFIENELKFDLSLENVINEMLVFVEKGKSKKKTSIALDNIDSIEALLKNERTSLWIKRTVKEGGYFYRRTEESDYSEVSADTYKDNICLILTQLRNNRYLEIYNKVFDEHPSFRSFNFLNYIEEKGLGDLSTVFTKAKELKHNIRIRNIMNFFFNFENIEQIYEKELLLELWLKQHDNADNVVDDVVNNSATLEKPLIPKKAK